MRFIPDPPDPQLIRSSAGKYPILSFTGSSLCSYIVGVRADAPICTTNAGNRGFHNIIEQNLFEKSPPSLHMRESDAECTFEVPETLNP